MALAKMTPDQEAAYALDYGVSRSDLSMAAQMAYDRLLSEREAGLPGQPEPVPEVRARSSSEVGNGYCKCSSAVNRKYALHSRTTG